MENQKPEEKRHNVQKSSLGNYFCADCHMFSSHIFFQNEVCHPSTLPNEGMQEVVKEWNAIPGEERAQIIKDVNEGSQEVWTFPKEIKNPLSMTKEDLEKLPDSIPVSLPQKKAGWSERLITVFRQSLSVPSKRYADNEVGSTGLGRIDREKDIADAERFADSIARDLLSELREQIEAERMVTEIGLNNPTIHARLLGYNDAITDITKLIDDTLLDSYQEPK